jgi:hypothetical protein
MCNTHRKATTRAEASKQKGKKKVKAKGWLAGRVGKHAGCVEREYTRIVSVIDFTTTNTPTQ